MSFQGVASTDYAQGLLETVKIGDMVLGIVTVRNYLLRDGQTGFRRSDVSLPAGWVAIASSIVRAGGDPRRLALVEVLAGTIVTPDSPRDRLAPRSSVPYWPTDQDPGSAEMVWGPGFDEGGDGNPKLYHWRGEKGVVSWWTGLATDMHAITLPTAGFSFISRPMFPGGTGQDPDTSWMTSDSKSTVDSTTPYARVLHAMDGIARTVWAWRRFGNRHTSATTSFRSWNANLSFSTLPFMPTLTLPINGRKLDVERNGLAVAWEHMPGLAGPQAGWAVRIETAGQPVRYWDAAAKALSPTVVINDGTLSSATLPPAAFPSGTGRQHAISVATCWSNMTLSDWSNPAMVTGVIAPTATAGFVGTDLAGSLASLRPQVAIGGAPSSTSLELTAWSASLVDLTEGVEVARGEGAFSTGSTSVVWAPNVEVLNGTRVQAIVSVQQSGGAWSAPATVEAVVDVDVPGIPALDVTMVHHQTSAAPGAQVRVDFPWEGDGYGWEGRSTLLRLERREGGEWVTVAEVMMPPGRTSATLDDYSASAGALEYRARGEGQAADGSRLLGDWGHSRPIVAVVPGEWIIDPHRPEAAVRVGLVTDDAREVALRTVTMSTLGRDEVLTATGTPMLATGQLTVRVDNPAQHEAVMALLTSGAVLKVTFPGERDVFDDGRTTFGESLWMRPTGDLSTSRVIPRGPWVMRHISFGFVTQRPPIARKAEVK